MIRKKIPRAGGGLTMTGWRWPGNWRSSWTAIPTIPAWCWPLMLVNSGKVLLFAADAQVGNWLSWQQLSWSLPSENGSSTKVTATDLLQRTVFYKVGHHGSHNATLRENGLELMTGPDLVAFLPVVEEMARKKGWGKMPFQPLLRRLDEKTAGRIFRSDKAVAETDAADRGGGKWKITLGPEGLYVDYTLSG